MATLQALTVRNIRSHTSFSVDFSERTTIITGANGSGKTSLLEAVYVVLRGISFRGSDKELLRAGEEGWKIEAHMDSGEHRVLSFTQTPMGTRKQTIIDSKKSVRLKQKDKYPVILFEPDDLRLLHGSPSRRRAFLDTLISQVDPQHATLLRKYERALKQRNSLLKNGIHDADTHFVWEVSLSELGASIIARRIRMVERINSAITDRYRAIARTDDTITLTYSYTAAEASTESLFNQLRRSAQREAILGYTIVGPHRHDITFLFNNKPAIHRASRGEVRSIIIALKYIERDSIAALLGVEPIVLLDDVFSELDEHRQELLTFGTGQHIITTTHLPNVSIEHIQNIHLNH